MAGGVLLTLSAVGDQLPERLRGRRGPPRCVCSSDRLDMGRNAGRVRGALCVLVQKGNPEAVTKRCSTEVGVQVEEVGVASSHQPTSAPGLDGVRERSRQLGWLAAPESSVCASHKLNK